MKFEFLNDENFMIYAMQAYDNPFCKGINEFNDDLMKIKYIKRLLNRFDKTKDLKERLILNHIILLNNVFGNEACCRILFFKICPKFHPYLKAFLEYLQILPKRIPEIDLTKIPSDHRITLILQKLK
jgi:hypothetical protein